MKRALTPDDRAAWAAYETASANAVDQYEAMPISHRNNGRIAKCSGCRTDVPSHELCRVCRRQS